MRRRLVVGGLALVAVTLAVGLFSMTVYNRAHNEQMYVAAAYLLVHRHALYTDFAFVQMPYSALNYALVYWLTGSSFHLIKAKLVNYAWMMLAAYLLYRRARRAAEPHPQPLSTGEGSARGEGSADFILPLTLVILFCANYYLLRATIEASNYALPLALASVAYGVWLRGVEGRMRYPLAAALAGLALGGAVGAKLYYATLAAPFVLAALLYPRHLTLGQRLLRGVLPLGVGGVVALLPASMYALRDWDRFAFNNLGYHLLNAQWRLQSGFTDTLTWASKLETARGLFTNPNYLILELWLAVALLWGITQTQGWQWPRPGVWLAGTAALTALVTAFTPSPLFPQYFAMPIPFLLLWMAELHAGMAAPMRGVLARLAVVCALVGILAVLPRHTTALTRLLRGEEPWATVTIQRESRQIRRELRAAGLWDRPDLPRLATLSPVMALEAYVTFYPELATGSFLLRVGDLLTPEEQARYVATSPSALADLLDAAPPAAILIGGEGDAEIPLRQYAEQRGYQRAEITLQNGELWLRP